jgi:hypothetical protein
MHLPGAKPQPKAYFTPPSPQNQTRSSPGDWCCPVKIKIYEQFSDTLLDGLLQPPYPDHVSRITTGPVRKKYGAFLKELRTFTDRQAQQNYVL